MTLEEAIVEKAKLPNIAKKKHGNSPELYTKDLIRAILDFTTLREVAKAFKVGEQTINRTVAKVLVPVFGNLNGGHETWKYKLLAFIEYKECRICNTIKPNSKFGKDKYTPHGMTSRCRSCRSTVNSLLYGRRKLRIPPWYPDEKEQIAKFYDNCPDGYEVDHIIPLQGFFVSGLHVLSNLQYLPAEENRKKGNHYCPDGETW